MLLRNQDKQQLLCIAAKTIQTPIEIWAYGSRVNGDAHDTSNLDLVVRTQDLTPVASSQWLNFINALSNSNIPILIQVFDWAMLPKSFHNNILQHYKVLKPLPTQ